MKTTQQDIDTTLRHAVYLHRAGRLLEAAPLYRSILQAIPCHPDANHNMGALLTQTGNPIQGLAFFRRALEENPAVSQYWTSYIHALLHCGLPQAAIKVLAQGKTRGLTGEAVSRLEQTLARLDRTEAAASQTERDLLVAYFTAGHHEEAEALARQLVQRYPGDAFGWKSLGTLLSRSYRTQEALPCLENALVLYGEDPETHNNFGNALYDSGRLDAALTHYGEALRLCPTYTEALVNAGNALKETGQLDQAMDRYAAALAQKPDSVDALVGLGNIYTELGRLSEALHCYRQALTAKPDCTEAHSCLLYALAHYRAGSSQAYLDQARAWGRTAESETNSQPAFLRAPRQGHPLRVGYMSGDFKRHAVSLFIEKVLAGHDRSRCSVHAYSTCPRTDAVTERMRTRVDHWCNVCGLSDAAAADRIRQDNIDVLVDLSGHTAYNRLGIFARRAAPVQAHYLGYFASTGLPSMDFFIADAIVVPPDEEAAFTETVWRLPRVWIDYQEGEIAPEPAWQPDPSGRIWFGSFNKYAKITPESVALWSRLLRACPRGALLLKASEFASHSVCASLRERFAAHGIGVDRLRLLPKVPSWREHMAAHDRLDVALDPVGGHCGVTTTCDALWMGLPVVTLVGQGMVGRMGASILTALGRPEWIASSEEAYVATALALAADQEKRRWIRTRQRHDMRRSPLCDTPGLVQALEDAYAGMLEVKCGQASP